MLPEGHPDRDENGVPTKEQQRHGCLDEIFQNGDLDWDGTSYQTYTWPNGSPNHPTQFSYLGPFGGSGQPYPQLQYETDATASEFLCDTTTGKDCVVKPLGSKFYPFWRLNTGQPMAGTNAPAAACLWSFGNVVPGVTTQTFGKDAQYGKSDVARFGGTDASKVLPNPAIHGKCPSFSMK